MNFFGHRKNFFGRNFFKFFNEIFGTKNVLSPETVFLGPVFGVTALWQRARLKLRYARSLRSLRSA